jgi:tetratricopeptide (TPR) repeat protein
MVAVAFAVVLVAGAVVWTEMRTYVLPSSDTVQLSRAPQAPPSTSLPDARTALNIPNAQKMDNAVQRAQREEAARLDVRDARIKAGHEEADRVAAPPEALGAPPVALGKPVGKGSAAEPADIGAIEKKFNELIAARNYNAALIEAQKLQTAAAAQFGDNDARYADALRPLAMIYMTQGRHGDAEAVLNRELAIRERSQGAHHPDVAQTLDDLASVRQAQGRTVEAEKLAQRASTIRRGVQQR